MQNGGIIQLSTNENTPNNNENINLGIIDFLEKNDTEKKYLLSPLINYCYKLMKTNLQEKLTTEKKEETENKITKIKEIRNPLSHYYYKSKDSINYTFKDMLNAVSKIDVLPIEIFNIAFNKIIADFKGSINKEKNDKGEKKSFSNIFKAKNRFNIYIKEVTFPLKKQNKEIQETFIEFFYTFDTDKKFRINAKFIEFLMVIDKQNNIIDVDKSYKKIIHLKNSLIELYNKKSKNIVTTGIKTIGKQDIIDLTGVIDETKLKYNYDLYKKIDKLNINLANIKKNNAGKISIINDNIANFLGKNKKFVEYKDEEKEDKNKKKHTTYFLKYNSSVCLQNKQEKKIEFKIELGKKSFDVKNKVIESLLKKIQDANTKKILDNIIYNTYIYNSKFSEKIENLKNKIDENMKNNYAKGIKLIKQIFEFEKEFFDGDKLPKENEKITLIDNVYVDFEFDSIKIENQNLIEKILEDAENKINLKTLIEEIKLLRNMAMHFDVPIYGDEYIEVNKFIMLVLGKCSVNINIKGIDNRDEKIKQKITVLKNFATALMEFLGIKSEYRKFLQEYLDYDIDKNRDFLSKVGFVDTDFVIINFMYKKLKDSFYKNNLEKSILAAMEKERTQYKKNLFELKKKIENGSIDTNKNEKLQNFIMAIKMLLKRFEDKNDK
jgi:hypothetical protein